MKINWFSPLPPARTEIAQYTIRLLPFLAKDADIELWTDQNSYDKSLESYAKVNQYNSATIKWQEINNSDINIYHIGNNYPFHGEIWKISQQSPGLAILHDIKVHDFISGFYHAHNDLEAYFKSMHEFYGNNSVLIGSSFWRGEISNEFMSEHYPLTHLITQNNAGIITHSQYAFEKAIENADNIPCGYIPLPYLSQNISTQQLSKVDNRKKRLIIFGHLGKNRCLDSFLEALSFFSQKQLFKLDIYGEVWNLEQLKHKIKQLDLQNLVYIHGFVPDAELDAALSHSDLAINLRYPTMGETSASQLRIWSHSLPSLVSNIGWYKEISDDTVAKVRVNHQIEDIHYHLQALLDSPQLYINMGKNGRNELEKNHNTKVYVESVLDFAKQVVQQRHCRLETYFSKRVANELSILGLKNVQSCDLKRLAESILFLT